MMSKCIRDALAASAEEAWFVVRVLPEQAGGWPEGSRGLSGAIPPERCEEFRTDPVGVAERWHPSRLPEPIATLPEVSAPAFASLRRGRSLRPPATLCQPSGLVTPDEPRAVDGTAYRCFEALPVG
jgi:hypothetical protein